MECDWRGTKGNVNIGVLFQGTGIHNILCITARIITYMYII